MGFTTALIIPRQTWRHTGRIVIAPSQSCTMDRAEMCQLNERLREIVSLFPGKRILVLGDVMLDEYIWGKVSRISPEAPVPVVEIQRVTYVPGGAANVANNIVSLGGAAYLCGVIGNDEPGQRLVNIFSANGVVADGIVVDPSRPTTLKTRIVAQGQHVVRADWESREPVREGIRDALWQYISETMGIIDVCLISDYNKGVTVASLLSETIELARSLGKPMVVDPKGSDYSKYRGATVVTPNKLEAGQAVNREITTEEDLVYAGQVLLDRLGSEAVLITRGEEGMSLFEREGLVAHVPALARAVYDVTGAGDTVVATLALALAAGANLLEGAYLANYAAGVVVGKVGTATVTPGELRRAIQENSGELR